jgi:hypothetical protein
MTSEGNNNQAKKQLLQSTNAKPARFANIEVFNIPNINFELKVPRYLKYFFIYLIVYCVIVLGSFLLLEDIFSIFQNNVIIQQQIFSYLYIPLLINALLPLVLLFNKKEVLDQLNWYILSIHCFLNLIISGTVIYRLLSSPAIWTNQQSAFTMLFLMIVLLALNGYYLYYMYNPIIYFLFQEINFKLLLAKDPKRFFLLIDFKLILPSEKSLYASDIGYIDKDTIVVTGYQKAIGIYHKLNPSLLKVRTIEHKIQLDEFNRRIEFLAEKISKIIIRRLESNNFEDYSVEKIEFYKNFYKNQDNIIAEFMMRAVKITKDHRTPLQVSLLKPPKINELDVYTNIYYLMHNWINQSGEKIDDLVII